MGIDSQVRTRSIALASLKSVSLSDLFQPRVDHGIPWPLEGNPLALPPQEFAYGLGLLKGRLSFKIVQNSLLQ